MLNPNPGQESFKEQFMDLLRSYELIMEESRYSPNVIAEGEVLSKFVNDILSVYQATTDQRVAEAVVAELHELIKAYGQSYDHEGATQPIWDRIATLTQKEDTHGR